MISHDFDYIGVPENADKKWRQKSTEQWLQLKKGIIETTTL